MNSQQLIATQLGGGGSLVGFAFPLILMFGIFYFLLIMPQQRRQKKWQEMLSNLKTGDKIVTTGGLRGTIVALRDDYVHLRVPPDNLRVEVTRASVATINTADELAEKAGK